MKSYIYTMGAKADPDKGWILNDPILTGIPTLGACMPNIRKAVEPGDNIFVISGRITGVKPYIVGGFEVAKKMDALTALAELPDYFRRYDENGNVIGNIIVDENGRKAEADYHEDWEGRLGNYIIGRNPIFLRNKSHVEISRDETVGVLSEIFDKSGATVHDIIGRWRKMNYQQTNALKDWLQKVKQH